MVGIMTWNMQGAFGGIGGKGSQLRKWMNSGKVDVILLQECGELLDALNVNLRYPMRCGTSRASVPIPLGGHSSHQFYINVYHRWVRTHVTHFKSVTHTRCSLAILSKSKGSGCALYVNGFGEERPVLSFRDPITQYTYYNLHAPSGSGNPKRMRYLLSSLNMIHGGRRLDDYVIGGDWNTEPRGLVHESERYLIEEDPHYHSYSTRDREATVTYDYFLTNVHPEGFAFTQTNVRISDHYPVFIQMPS